MRAVVKDTDAISALRPLDVIGYLKTRGWKKYSERQGIFSVWVHDSFPDAELVVPLHRNGSDFIQAFVEVLKELEAVENRSQIEIMSDLMRSGFDVVRIAARSANTTDGTIRIADGLALVEHAREALLSAACSSVKPRSVFHSRKPQQANEYMDSARLGQTEQGSYVLTVLSPVAPQLNAYSDTDLFPEEPFERKVVKTLAQGVSSVVLAADQSASMTTFEPFQSAIDQGVSANLCEAIAGFFEAKDLGELKLSVSWSQNREAPKNIPIATTIHSDLVPTIREAARIFRARDALDFYEVIGPVVRLARDDGQQDGLVTIIAPIEGAVRKIIIRLNEFDYELAMRAHKEYRNVRIIGTVIREGRSYKLNNATGLMLASDDDDPI